MKPHIEEAWRALRMADRDALAFNILAASPGVHLAIICFHAQQAIEKSLKAVLFSHRIEFRRTHNQADLASLLRQCCKMATGSGKTIVMAMAIAWHILNKVAYRVSPSKSWTTGVYRV